MKETFQELDEQLQLLRDDNYAAEVDVTDAVMKRISNRPLLVLNPQRHRSFRIVSAVAACVALLVAAHFVALYTRNFDEAQISNMMAEVYTYGDEYASDYNSVSSEMDVAYLFD